MKILKLLAMLCVITTVSVSVTSCNKDDDDEKDPIVGTWRDTYGDSWDEITFKSDGTYTWTFYEDGKPSDTDIEIGTYVYNHPVLKLTYRDEDGEDYDTFTVKSISSSELAIDMYGDIVTYKKQ
ncbi:MAG: hypothetical protein K2O69_01400 [Odoribacter sp.]|nr:hypothetical protein [Odoribacter sp.]